MKIFRNLSWLILVSVTGLACHKDFLEKKPSTNIVQPTTLEEFQSLLENQPLMNGTTGLGVLAGEDYIYASRDIWLSTRTATERNSFIWSKDLYEGETSEDWSMPYATIFYANCVLKGLGPILVTERNKSQYNLVKGWALFARSFAYFDLVNSYSRIFSAGTAEIDLGVPLRLDPSIDEVISRATVAENYRQLLSDLHSAAGLLPTSLPVANRNRPSKIAAHALLSRVYLLKGEYGSAELHADSMLMLYDRLIDYNTLDRTTVTPFSTTNNELIYSRYASTKAAYSASSRYIQISTELLRLYAPNDLRPLIYFARQSDGSFVPKRGYQGVGSQPFMGLATDEVYLIKAECLARRNQFVDSMNWLNRLLVKRWSPNATVPAVPYQSLTASSGTEALAKVLLERRKELVWRGLRWEDIKRLNRDGANITLKRELSGQEYILAPNSPLFLFPIPNEEIMFSGIKQNER
ncbi:RagB/SusD family nutrient uptake outer membrane protein [Pedobacter helvus]|uniref:RagB/SusD family nutrient uptake outer membrane protein n=1 Tax=Pedobacter helvus TaxID=2563444 RepID=A0ABW9JNW7_9SPHI|nr:RagB/SusD family nutrient uptake outer membrane protein [Pedobacter ureilyticus]